MARIVHGFTIGKKNYYIPTILFAVIIPIILVIIVGKINEVAIELILHSIVISFLRLLGAYFISLFISITIVSLIGQSKVGDLLIPVFDLLQNLPSFALIPLFVAILHYSDGMAIAFAASSILWPILFYTLHSVKTAPKDLNNAAQIFGARGIKMIIYYYFPLMFPAIVTGSIVGFSIGWEAIIGIEMLGLKSGIGFFLNSILASSQTAFALGIASLLVLVFIINRLVWMPLLKKSELYE
ncbi:MAG: ABC transporter permease subunit [Candidatus Paceibacterota bacterium]